MMFPGSRSCINLVSRVVHPLTHIDDARAYIVPYLHRRFTPRHLAPTVGLSARGFKIRWVKSSSTTTTSSSPHRPDVKFFINNTKGLDIIIASLVQIRFEQDHLLQRNHLLSTRDSWSRRVPDPSSRRAPKQDRFTA